MKQYDGPVETVTASSVVETPESESARRNQAFTSDAAAAPLPTVETEHYHRGRELARGGMGRVIAAVDRRYGRQVAIKELLRRGARAEARFQREARITARLQHPSIVPMYEAGRWPDGEPFIAMKHVSGRPLKELIAECDGLRERIALLPNVIAAVDAIAYAHSRDCIHRDLKPANVLVGDFGETVVIDWGLARELDTADDDTVNVGPYRSTDGDLTTAGSVMGTPMYMAPEQAAGELVDQRSDVYSLGALLYHTLTGSPPYADVSAKTTRELVEVVLARAPQPATSVEPDLPADLDAIVSKAMARAPADRYSSAAVMAEDLRRFQTGKLVGAHAYSAWQLLRRWLARHRALVAVTAAAAVLVVVFAGLALNRVVKARDAAQASQAQAEASRAAANRNRLEAEQLVDFLVTDMRDALADAGRIDLLGKVASRARAYNQRHRSAVGSLEEMLRRTKAGLSLGDVFRLKGARKEAEAEYRASLALTERYMQRHGAVARALHMKGFFEVRLGLLAQSAGDRAAAEKHLKEGLALRRRVAEMGGFSKKAWLLENVNNSINRLGALYHQHKEYDRAEPLFEEGLAVCKRLIELVPDEPIYKRNLSIAYLNLGSVALRRKRYDQARTWFASALVIRRALSKRFPKVLKRSKDVALVLALIGDNEQAAGNYPAALRALLEARAKHRLAVRAHPENADWREYLAIAEDKLSTLQGKMGNFRASLDTAKSYLALMNSLTATDKSNAILQVRLGLAHVRVGYALEGLERPRQARAHLNTALGLFEKNAKLPSAAEARDELNAHLKKLAAGQK